jgi:hypothetical protein
MTVLASVLTLRADQALPADCQSEVGRLQGRIVMRRPSTLVATFDGPGRAVGCASLLIALMNEFGVRARAGVHVGECDPATPEGPVFDSSHALAESALPGAVHASRTVVDLVPGSGLLFEPVTLSDSVVWKVVR